MKMNCPSLSTNRDSEAEPDHIMTFYNFHADFNTESIFSCRLDSSLSDSDIQGCSTATDCCQVTGYKIEETASTTTTTNSHDLHDDLCLDFLSDDSGLRDAVPSMALKKFGSLENANSIMNLPTAMASTCCHNSSTSDRKAYHNVKLCTASGARLTIRYRKHRPSIRDDHDLSKPEDFCSSMITANSQISGDLVNTDASASHINPDNTHINSACKLAAKSSTVQDSGHIPSTGDNGASSGQLQDDHDLQLAIRLMDLVDQIHAAPYLLNIESDGWELYQHLTSWPSHCTDDMYGSSSGCGSNAAPLPQFNAIEPCLDLQQCQILADCCSNTLKNRHLGKLGRSINENMTDSPHAPPHIYVDHEDNPDIICMDRTISYSNNLVDHEMELRPDHDVDQEAIPKVCEGIFYTEQLHEDIWLIYCRPELDEQIEMLNRSFPDPLVRLQELSGSVISADADPADIVEATSVSDYFHEDQYLCFQFDPITYSDQNIMAGISALAQSSWTAFFELEPPSLAARCQLEAEAHCYDQPPRQAQQEENKSQYNIRQESSSDHHLSLVTWPTNIHSDSSASGCTIAMTTKCKKLRKKRKRRISPLPNNMLQCLLSNGLDPKCCRNEEAVIDLDRNTRQRVDDDDNHHHHGPGGVSVTTTTFTYSASPRKISCTSKNLKTSLSSTRSHYTTKQRKMREINRQDGVRIGDIREQLDVSHGHSISQTAELLVDLVQEAADIPLNITSMASTGSTDLGRRPLKVNAWITNRTRRSGTQHHVRCSHKHVGEMILAESVDVDISHETTKMPPAATQANHLKRERSSRSSGQKEKQESMVPSCSKTGANNKRHYEPYINSIMSSRGSSSSLLPEAAVAIMRSWFMEHMDFPFADKDQKRDLVSATGLTLSQVENWLSNHRHRLKIKKSDYTSRKSSNDQ